MDLDTLYKINGPFCLIVGVPANLLLYWLIRRKSTEELKMYSRILLTTCYTDVLSLIFFFAVNPVQSERSK